MKRFLSLSLVTLLLLNTDYIQDVFAINFNNNYYEKDTQKYIFKEVSKKDVTYTNMFSTYHIVSPIVNSGPAGAQIKTNREVSFSTLVSGEIKGLDISTDKIYISNIGAIFNVEPHTNAYIGCRVQYLQEKGTRVVKNKITGNVKYNNYNVKIPFTKQYALIDAETEKPITFLILNKYTNTFLIGENPMD